LRKMYHRVRNHYGRTQWYSKVMGLKWKLVSIHLKIVVILTQDRCTICVERTIGLETFWMHPMELIGVMAHVNLILVHSVIVLVSKHDRCKVCTKRTIGSEIGLDAPDGTPR
jgi:hypothetical protein